MQEFRRNDEINLCLDTLTLNFVEEKEKVVIGYIVFAAESFHTL